MLNFISIFQNYGVPSGVLHCGAQLFHIRKLYLGCGLFNTIWVEDQQFFYEFGLNLINGTDEKIFNHKFISPGSIQNFFKEQNLNINNYNFIHISIPTYIISGLDIFEKDIDNFKFISIEATKNIDDKNTDADLVKKWFIKKRYKLIEEKSIDNLCHMYFVKKRDYNKKVN